MHQIDGVGATAQNLFTEGDASQAIPATQVTADWLNSVQEELVAIAQHNGGALDKANNGQVLAKILEIASGAGLANDFTQDNGYTTLPGGLILQWCTISTTSTEQQFAYPIAFPTLSLNVLISPSGQVDGAAEIQQAALNNNSNFIAANDSGSSRTARVIALGV